MMERLALLSILVCSAWGYAPLHEPGVGGGMQYNDAAFIQDLMERINRDMEPAEPAYLDFGNKLDHSGLSLVPGRSTKDSEFFDENDYDSLLGPSGHPSIRDQEYLQHSTLYGHKFGGSGSSGSLKVKGQNVPTEVKSDTVLPAYCNPPNPCPVDGMYTVDDGCLEVFENTAAFSRAYQASQDCMCDTEHMFDCRASQASQVSDDESDMGPQSSFLDDMQMDGQHKRVVAKKFYNKNAPQETLSRLNEMARNAAAHDSGMKLDENPFLQGEKLPIAAKKGHNALHQG